MTRELHLFDLVNRAGGKSSVRFVDNYGVICPYEVTTNGSIPFFARWLAGHVKAGSYTVGAQAMNLSDAFCEETIRQELSDKWQAWKAELDAKLWAERWLRDGGDL